jgi:hypothetical protein
VCVSAGKMLAVVLKGWLARVTSLSEKRQYAFHWGCEVKVKRKEGATARDNRNQRAAPHTGSGRGEK